MKKPRSDSVIAGLPQNQRDQIEAWLCEENLSYADCVKRCVDDLNAHISTSSLRSFRDACAQRRMLDRIAASRKNANEVVTQFKDNPADIYSALIGIVGQTAFESSMNGEKLDPELVFNFTKLVMAAKKQTLEEQTLKLNERRVALLEQKAAAYDRAQAALQEINNSGGVTPETLKKIERELKLL